MACNVNRERRPPPCDPIRIAAQLHPQHGAWPGLRAAVLRAEELGYDIAYTWDHFFPLYGDRDGAHLECWTTLAAWAEATSRDRARRRSSPATRTATRTCSRTWRGPSTTSAAAG